MFERLELENFTVFEKASFEWAAGINVFVGANGTGKTHLLKLLYCLRSRLYNDNLWARILNEAFVSGGIAALRRDDAVGETKIGVVRNGVQFSVDFDMSTMQPVITPRTPSVMATGDVAPVYLPPKEILSIAPGLLSLFNKYELSLDGIYRDVLEHAYTPHLRRVDEKQSEILRLLESLIGGGVNVQGDVFFVGSRTMHLVAEGHRKLALIWQLIRNGSISFDIPLLWDEPEANLNPSLMKEVVKVLLMLAQNGVQIFVATHSDAFMRELDYQKGDVVTRFFALEKTDQGVVPHPAERYIDVKPNPIEDEYLRLYDLEIQRSLGNL